MKEQRYTQNYPDLTRLSGGKSVGIKLEPIIQHIDRYNLEQLKNELNTILCDPTTHVSKEKVCKYQEIMNNSYSLRAMQAFVTEIYFSAAKMGLKQMKFK